MEIRTATSCELIAPAGRQLELRLPLGKARQC